MSQTQRRSKQAGQNPNAQTAHQYWPVKRRTQNTCTVKHHHLFSHELSGGQILSWNYGEDFASGDHSWKWKADKQHVSFRFITHIWHSSNWLYKSEMETWGNDGVMIPFSSIVQYIFTCPFRKINSSTPQCRQDWVELWLLIDGHVFGLAQRLCFKRSIQPVMTSGFVPCLSEMQINPLPLWPIGSY